jgi:hypothetical protein
MTKAVRQWFWIVGILALGATAALAQVPSGQVTLSFDNSTAPVIDLSGEFSPTNQVIVGAGGQEVSLSFSGIIVNHSPNGKLSGSGAAVITVSGSPVAVDYVVTGKASGGGTKPIRVSLTVRARGTGSVSGQFTKLSMVITYNLTYNSTDTVLEGTSRGTVTMSSTGKSRVNSPVGVPLPDASNGSWAALLDVVPFKQIGGSGEVLVLPGAGRTLGGNLSGNFSAGQNLSKIKLTGSGATRGFNVRFNLGVNAEGAAELETMRGRILGQTVVQ